MYLTYDEYVDMGGALEDTDFDVIILDVNNIINWYTFNRLVNDTTFDVRVKHCAFKLTDLLYTKQSMLLQSTNGTAPIKSQENDGVKIQLEAFTASDYMTASSKEIDSIISRYLTGVTNSQNRLVLYRGLYPNE